MTTSTISTLTTNLSTRTTRTTTSPKTRTKTRTKTTNPEFTDPAPSSTTFLGLGANLGHPRRQLLDAILELSRRFGPLRVAPLFRTEPESDLSQPDYLNTVVQLLETPQNPLDLLAVTQAIEARAGREASGPRNAPRPLDIDLLLIGGRRFDTPNLTLPHPRMHRRAFVLAPLVALAPDLVLLSSGQTVAEVWDALPKTYTVTRIVWGLAP